MVADTNILLRHLPEIYQDSLALRQLLTAFDEVLFGSSADHAATAPGLEQIIAALPNLFNSQSGQTAEIPFARTPAAFLPWLAEWVALEPWGPISEEQYRRVIAGIVPLYAMRGTKPYLLKLLTLCYPDIGITVDDEVLPTMVVGKSRIGMETRLGGDIPFHFYVKLTFPAHMTCSARPDETLLASICRVIDSAKPAHTAYQLEWVLEETDPNVGAWPVAE